MDNKGLSVVDYDGSLEVQYALGIKCVDCLKLESISAKQERFNDMRNDDKGIVRAFRAR